MKPSHEPPGTSLIEAMCLAHLVPTPARFQTDTPPMAGADSTQNKEARTRVIKILKQVLDLLEDIEEDAFAADP